MVLLSTFLIYHFELFGLHQVALAFAGRSITKTSIQEADSLQNRTPPDLSGHRHRLLGGACDDGWIFVVVTTAYILVGIYPEERDLLALFGEQYKKHRLGVGMLIPFRWRA